MNELNEYQVYAYRWHVMLIYGTLSLLNAIVWISFAPILPTAVEYYQVSKVCAVVLLEYN